MTIPANHHKVENSGDARYARQEGGTNSQSPSESQDAAREQEPQSNALPKRMGWFNQSLQQSSFKFSLKHMPSTGSRHSLTSAGSDIRLAELDFNEPSPLAPRASPRLPHASPRPSHASARPSQAKVLKRTL
jgi:hypothetical protein